MANSRHPSDKELDLKKKNSVIIIPRLSAELATSNVEAAIFRATHEILFWNIAPFFLPFLLQNLSALQAVNPDIKSFNALTLTCRRTHALFQKPLIDIRTERLRHLANLILSGEEKEVEEAVAIVKKIPSILNYSVRATDPKGRIVEGKPLQIAAMAGDLDLKEGLEEKDRGIVERLALAANLPREEVDKQLEVITSEEAILANEARNQRVLTAVKAFGEGILKIKETIDGDSQQQEMSFKDFQSICQPVIDQLEKVLQPDPESVIRRGYIFDIKIRRDAEKWFSGYVTRFGGWWSNQSDVFYVNGIGKLDNNLSARDAHVVRAGIGNFVEGGNVPRRTVKNSDGSSYFFNTSSGLGVSFYIAYYGGRARGLNAASRATGVSAWNLMSSKNSDIAKLTQRLDNPKRQRTCLIM